MLVSELIELLQAENPNAEVHFAYNYGDHWNTEVAPEVTDVSTGKVEHSEYHSMPKTLDEDSIEEEGDDVNPDVVILR